MTAVIGRNAETGEMIKIGDIERQAGLYVLGKPRMGKSTLLVNLLLQDVANGHGAFFLDPHGDAIDDFIKRLDCSSRKILAFLFDPENPTHTFGMNFLQCDDVTNRQERLEARMRILNVFEKFWENEWGPWLQLVLQN